MILYVSSATQSGTEPSAWLLGHQSQWPEQQVSCFAQHSDVTSPSFTLHDGGTCRGRSYVCRRTFLVLGHAALQVEGQVVAVHQHALAKLLLKLLHVRLDSREVKFLMGAQWRRVGSHGRMEKSKTFADHIYPDLHMIT